MSTTKTYTRESYVKMAVHIAVKHLQKYESVPMPSQGRIAQLTNAGLTFYEVDPKLAGAATEYEITEALRELVAEGHLTEQHIYGNRHYGATS